VIPSLVIIGSLTTTFNKDFNNTWTSCVTYTQVQLPVFDFIVIRSLMITIILTTTFNQDFNNRRGQ
jgi:hypothetical protein